MNRKLKFRSVLTFDDNKIVVIIPDVTVYGGDNEQAGVGLDEFSAALLTKGITYLGDGVFNLNGDFIEPDFDTYDGDEWVYFDAPIMQYTGLQDEKSKEIYDGDILNNEVSRWEVIFHTGCFCGKMIAQINPDTIDKEEKEYIACMVHQNSHIALRAIRGIEIIGNIHENQTL